MKLWLSLGVSALLITGPLNGQEPVATTPSQNTDKLRQAGAEILFWSQAQRDANFPHMENIFPGDTAKAGKHVYPFRKGKSLNFGADDPVAAHMAAQNVAGLLVVQNGRIRLEQYARGYSAKGRYTSFSVAKSLTSTLVGAAIADGYIKSVDDPITRYIPEFTGTAYEGVTVKQVLTMTSGVRWNEDYTDPNSDVASMYKEAPKPGVDQTVAYLSKLPREAAPGSKWVYKTGETNLIGVLVSRATGKSLAQYAQEKIWQPFGMEQDLFWMQDAGGQDIGGCCISVSLRDYARIGQFILNDGIAGGKRIVPKGWFAEATHTHSSFETRPGGYGYQWWINADGTFQAQGIFGQVIYIDPKRKLIIAMSSAWPKASTTPLWMERTDFIRKITAAIDRK